jgi:mycothiol synthase
MSTVRGFMRGDESAIRAIMDAAFDVDRMPGWTRANIEHEISRLPADPFGVLVAEDGGVIVGYWGSRFDDLRVHPAHRRRGHGRRLLEAALAHAAEGGDTELALHVPAHLPGSLAFARAVGLTYSSSLWLFRLPAERPVPPPAVPPDLVLQPWTDGIDVDAFVSFANAAWEGHPGRLGLTPELARLVAELPGFDPAGICLVSRIDDPSRPIAFAKVEVRPDEGDGPIGWIGQIGVLPAQRGRGLGRMLLRWGVAFVRERGARVVELAVEAANDRALGLYRRAGFEPAAEWPHWSRPLDVRVAPAGSGARLP